MFSRLSPYLLWAILSLPALGMIFDAANAETTAEIHGLLHPTGEFAARFMIIAMLATPLMLFFKGRQWPRWFVRNRRYFGVAAFGYAVLHVAAYLWTEPVARVIAELTEFEIWTGWIAFLIFVPLAVTSSDWAVARLGRSWKPLQRWTYAAAVLTLLHWASLHDWNGVAPALVHFVPLAIAEGYRIWWQFLRPRPLAA